MSPNNSNKIRGWLFDVYPSVFGKFTVWIITQSGQRIKLTDTFRPCIYVSAKQEDLERLTSQLYSNQKIFSIKFVYKYTSPSGSEKSRVLEITVKDCRQIRALTLEILRMGDYLRYELHNCDIQSDRAYLFSRGLFPLAFVEVAVSKSGLIYTLLDTVESTDYLIPQLRFLRLEVEIAKKGVVANFEDTITNIRLKQPDKKEVTIDYGDEATKLLQLVYAIKELDPDVIVTASGDAFLLPYLIHRASLNNIDNFVLSRDNIPFDRKSSGRTYVSYGRTFYRAGIVRLYGRIHLDENNTFIVREANFEGLIEIARTCRVPLHMAARFSIGSSMSSIQFYQAIKDDILLPRNKKIPETFKSAIDLLVGDRGGFIFEPRLGIHDSVGELDFSSMYPALMCKYNISAETVLCKCCPDSKIRVPSLNYHICEKRVGMVPKTVNLALTKRLHYKHLRDESSIKELKEKYDYRQTALKWILVTCFGYLGFRNSKFGTVDGHIGVCAFAREIFLKTTNIVQNEGFEIIHGIVDSLWLKKKNAAVDDYRHLCKIITDEIKIPINFEGYYKWIVFLPSKMHPNISVLNRYFGIMENNKIKVRGIEVRKHDTPKFIYNAQIEMIKALSTANDATEFNLKIPDALTVVKNYRQKLLDDEVTTSDLIVTKHLSKNPKKYKQHVSQLIAAEQLIKQNVEIPAGSDVLFLFKDTKNKRHNRRVVAEQLLEKNVSPDKKYYLLLLYEAAAALLSFKGYTQKSIHDEVYKYSNENLDRYL